MTTRKQLNPLNLPSLKDALAEIRKEDKAIMEAEADMKARQLNKQNFFE